MSEVVLHGLQIILKKILVRMVGAAGIPIYPKGGRLCLSACPGDGGVKKIAAHPPDDDFWNRPE